MRAPTWSFGWYHRTAAYALFGAPQQTTVVQEKSLAENRIRKQPSGAAKEAANGTPVGSTAERRPKPKRARSIGPYGTKCWERLTAHCTVWLNHSRSQKAKPSGRAASAMRRIDRATFDPAAAVSPKIARYEDTSPGSLTPPPAGSVRSKQGTWGGIWTKTCISLPRLSVPLLP